MHPRARLRIALIAAFACMTATGCATSQPSPIPAGSPCQSTDPHSTGYYPALEKRLPASWNGGPPQEVTSGRYCSAAGLGYLAGHGVSELRYGAASWTAHDTDSTISTVVYAADGLTVPLLVTTFERGAQSTPGTQGVDERPLTVHGRQGTRIDALMGSNREVRIVWPSADGQVVNVVVASNVTEEALASAEAAFTS